MNKSYANSINRDEYCHDKYNELLNKIETRVSKTPPNRISISGKYIQNQAVTPNSRVSNMTIDSKMREMMEKKERRSISESRDGVHAWRSDGYVSHDTEGIKRDNQIYQQTEDYPMKKRHDLNYGENAVGILALVMERVNVAIQELRKEFQVSLEFAIRKIRADTGSFVKKERSDIEEVKSHLESLFREYKSVKSSLADLNSRSELAIRRNSSNRVSESFNLDSSIQGGETGPRVRKEDIGLGGSRQHQQRYRFEDSKLNTTANFEDNDNIFFSVDKKGRSEATGLDYFKGSKKINIPTGICQTDYEKPRKPLYGNQKKPSTRF